MQTRMMQDHIKNWLINKNMKLVKSKDKILKQKVRKFEGHFGSIVPDIEKMFELMAKNNGIGLAAPQVGLSENFFIMNVPNCGNKICINPEILSYSMDVNFMKESCLSFPNEVLSVERPDFIEASYTIIDGTRITEWMHGLEARCFQHEFDHLSGITFHERIK